MPGYRSGGILIQEMRRGVGELLVGLTRDPLVGPIVTVAMGGVLTEIYKDASVRAAPVSAAEAADMLDEIKGVALLRGFRGAPRGDLEAAAKAIAGFSRLALSASVSEAEINPLLVGAEGDGAMILDALVRIA